MIENEHEMLERIAADNVAALVSRMRGDEENGGLVFTARADYYTYQINRALLIMEQASGERL